MSATSVAGPPIPLSPNLGPEISGELRNAVDPEAGPLIAAIQRASRYANVSKSGDIQKVSYSRRVITLGIVETALAELTSEPEAQWVAEWVRRVEPEIDTVLREQDHSRLVQSALGAGQRVEVSPRLRSAIEQARAIARRTMGKDLIELRHLVFALTLKPGSAFINFRAPPTAADLADLRAQIVKDAERFPRPGELLPEWQRLLSEASAQLEAEETTSTNATAPVRTLKGSGHAQAPKRAAPKRAAERSSRVESDPGQSAEKTRVADAGPKAAERRQDRPDEQAAGNASKEGPAAGPGTADEEKSTDFVLDDAELDQDQLERSVLAIGLGRRLHGIWRRTNAHQSSSSDPRGAHEGSRAAFVVHLDAPWGGGKTTFANFLSCVLNPSPAGAQPARFLRERYGDCDLGGIFLEDPPPTAEEAERQKRNYGEEARRPWINVYFNAWQMEHIKPPWWAFYQVIRQCCFRAIRREGDRPWDPTGERRRMPQWIERWEKWLILWAKEFAWRFSNPKIFSLLLTALVSIALVILLASTGWWGIIESKDSKGVGFILESPVGLVLSGLGGIAGLWGLGALVTESIVPGTDTLAERLNLGSGDPFGRFRRHFARTMQRVRRPVLVIVDDLDRCEPAFVVDLVRGIQTLLRSPRVVFVILGDRDWIERAFEAQHEAMNKVDVGPEQSFGARFVEKAIQMSFILPALGDEARRTYLRHVVLGDRATAASRAAPLAPQTAATLRQFVNSEAARPDVSAFDSRPILHSLGEKFSDLLAKAGVDKDSAELEQLISETLAIRAASDEGTEQDIKHELEAFARFFPANPRQIKRIINSITIYYAVAIQRADIDPDRIFRAQLAAWIIVMTEWPQTWRLLASFPDLVTILTASDPGEAMKAAGLGLPGSAQATDEALGPIRADSDLMALITGKGPNVSHPALEADVVRKLAQLTPLHSRMRRLGAAPAGPTAPSAGGR